ncbi:MAG: ATP-binding protein [Clostridiales Family XIII bacterium]|jgi:AAA+ ATPase superfamily predicted ATPase|nr:ATP-binding protein [Clostridiales Family XIII bacterium]
MFIGRERELQRLNERYEGKRFEFVAIYGRRRVGKTALIREFIKDKKAIFFTAAENSKDRNLALLSKSILEADASYSSFEDAFEAVYTIAKSGRTVFVIDEYPYIAKSYKPLSSLLQQYIDNKFKQTDIFIILCGSSMSFMENQVLGYKSPLYGRRTGQFKLEPFSFEVSRQYHKGFGKREQAVLYGITGGIPQYLELMDGGKSLKYNIIHSFLTSDTMLFEEPVNLLKQELREPQIYNDIITAIAGGASQLNKISDKSYVGDTSKTNKYLRSLISLGIVKKEESIMAQSKRKSIYRLNDGMFRFWYRFVPHNLAKIHLGLGESVYASIESQISDFMGEVFEDICKQWLWKENIENRLPFDFQDCGRWWGTNPLHKAEQEIDILAFSAGNKAENKQAIFCECKWTNENISDRIIDELIDKSAMFAYEKKYYYLFSKSGFTSAALARAGDNIRLISFGEMF